MWCYDFSDAAGGVDDDGAVDAEFEEDELVSFFSDVDDDDDDDAGCVADLR